MVASESGDTQQDFMLLYRGSVHPIFRSHRIEADEMHFSRNSQKSEEGKIKNIFLLKNCYDGQIFILTLYLTTSG